MNKFTLPLKNKNNEGTRRKDAFEDWVEFVGKQ